jgi:hypothetical protein
LTVATGPSSRSRHTWPASSQARAMASSSNSWRCRDGAVRFAWQVAKQALIRREIAAFPN